MDRGVPGSVVWLGCLFVALWLFVPVGCGDAVPSEEVSDASETSSEGHVPDHDREVSPDALADSTKQDTSRPDDTTTPEPNDTSASDTVAEGVADDAGAADTSSPTDTPTSTDAPADAGPADGADGSPQERSAPPEPTPDSPTDGGGQVDQSPPQDTPSPDVSPGEPPVADRATPESGPADHSSADAIGSDAASGDGAVADKAPTSALDDEFSGSSLSSSWQTLNTSLFTYSVSGGALRLVPKAYCVWYHRDRGPYIYKTISGNFTMTARIRARKASNTSQAVGATNAPYQFAGIMLRNPTVSGTDENYVFVVVGHHSPGNGLVIEQKTTVNGRSTVSTTSWASGDAELRLCRVGSAYNLYARPVGASTWQRMRRYTRSDLPSTLQVGMISYTYTYRYDLQASYDYIRFQTGLQTEADCTK